MLGYAVAVAAGRWGDYAHPGRAIAVFAALAAWTAYAALAYARPSRRRWPLLLADLAVAAGAVLATRLVESPEQIAAGAPTLPTFWVSASVLAWALRWGPLGGVAAATLLAGALLAERSGASATTYSNIALLYLASAVLGYVARLAVAAEAARARAAEASAATAERERLARDIHDGVLQVLALVQRRGAEVGGEAAELGRLAGEQERALRALVAGGVGGRAAGGGAGGPGGTEQQDLDLSRLLAAAVAAHPGAQLSAPATPVLLPAPQARELAAAVTAALDNVARHVGPPARAWVLLEREPGEVLVTVRDEGPGIPEGRLAAARAEGRLGVSASITGRLAGLGGRADLTTGPGGTEWELRLPAADRG